LRSDLKNADNTDNTLHYRIISFPPSATEILYELGVGDQVLAVTHESNYPK